MSNQLNCMQWVKLCKGYSLVNVCWRLGGVVPQDLLSGDVVRPRLPVAHLLYGHPPWGRLEALASPHVHKAVHAG